MHAQERKKSYLERLEYCYLNVARNDSKKMSVSCLKHTNQRIAKTSKLKHLSTGLKHLSVTG